MDFLNESAEGSFLAGWIGGQIGGALAGFVPGVGTMLGGFFGFAATDWIDKSWDGIDWGKAVVSALLSIVFDRIPASINDESAWMQYLLSYRGILVGFVNGMLSAFYK